MVSLRAPSTLAHLVASMVRGLSLFGVYEGSMSGRLGGFMNLVIFVGLESNAEKTEQFDLMLAARALRLNVCVPRKYKAAEIPSELFSGCVVLHCKENCCISC